MATIRVDHEYASETRSTPLGNREAKVLLSIVVTVVPFLAVSLFIPDLLIQVAYCLPLVLCALLYFIIKLLRAGIAPLPRVLSVGGILFIIGGKTFDMFATVLHSPSLDLEGNPVARVFLDSGHPLWFVYSYALIAQGLFHAFLSLAWLALLKHRHQLVASIGHPESMREFLCAAFGRTYSPNRRWWSLSIHLTELPHAYHVFWFLVIVLVSASLESWYLGLEWFNVVHSIRWPVVAASIALAMLSYFTWLRLASRCIGDAIEQTDEPEPVERC